MEADMAEAFFMVETNGKSGICAETGKPIIRFEPHVFANPKYMSQYNVNPSDVPWSGNSSTERKDKWLALGFKHGSSCKNNENEYTALNEAIKINEQLAYASTSMGVAQIMGFNCTMVGYKTPKDMFDDFSKSEENQIRAFFKFVSKRAKGEILRALEEKRFIDAALLYNGKGQEHIYGAKLEKYYNNIKG